MCRAPASLLEFYPLTKLRPASGACEKKMPWWFRNPAIQQMSAVVYGIILECFHTSQVISLCIFDPSTRTSTIWKAWLVPHFWLPKAWYLMISVRGFFRRAILVVRLDENLSPIATVDGEKKCGEKTSWLLVVYVTIYKVLYITGGGFPDCWTINSIRHTMWKNPYPKDFEDLPWWRCLTMGQVPIVPLRMGIYGALPETVQRGWTADVGNRKLAVPVGV